MNLAPAGVSFYEEHEDAMSIGDLQFHPLSNIFPLIDGQAYADLCADVAKFGIREPVWLYDGQILDGRNRWRAANETGADCPTRTYEGDRRFHRRG